MRRHARTLDTVRNLNLVWTKDWSIFEPRGFRWRTPRQAQLTDLVRRAEAGNEIVLTAHGHPAICLVSVKTIPDTASCEALLDALREAGAKAKDRVSAARSQDFLYGNGGLPR